MPEPLSVAASIVGVTVPALHGTRLLLDDLQGIADAPKAVESLKEDLLSVDMALKSLQAVKDPEWKSLGETVAHESKVAISNCKRACDMFRTDLQRWTRHSEGGKLSWQDRANVGFFKQRRVKSTSEQLQTCKLTINSVVGIATLYSSIRHTHITEEIKKTISMKQTEITGAIAATDKHLAEVESTLGELRLAGTGQEGIQNTEDKDKDSALEQVEEERIALDSSRKLLKELLSMTPPKSSSTIPFRRDPDFVDRRTLLDQIHQKCSAPAARTALVGLGGVGKSQLAIEYSYQVRDQSPETWVFWVHASNAARFEESYRAIADHVKIPNRRDPKADIFKLVHDWLRDEKNGKWLLILDNADDTSYFFESQTTSQAAPASGLHDGSTKPLSEYLPQSQNGSILVTTRTRSVAPKLVEERDIIDVEPMDEVHALALFEKKLGIQSNRKDIAELAAALEFMPLAVVQAAAYINQRAPRCSVRQYIEKFQKTDKGKTRLLTYEAGHLRRDRDAKNSIIITWQISFDYIHQVRPSAANLLSLMSFFDRQGIPEALVQNRGETRNRREDLERRRSDNEGRDEDSGSESSVNDEFEDDILTLRNYSFIFVNVDTTTFGMHRLVQLATRKWLEAHGQLEGWKQQYIKNLCTEFPTGKYENWPKCRALFPHAKSALAQQPEGEDSLREWALLLYNAAWYAWLRGSFTDAEKMSIKSMKVREKQLGQEHVETLSSIAMVALAYKLGGLWKEAEELEVQVMETSKRVLGQEHPDTLTSMANLASTYRNQGRWKEAEELEVQVMETSRTVLGQEHPSTLTSMNNLAWTWKQQGRDAEALQLIAACLELLTKKLGANHPHTLVCTQTYNTWTVE